MTYVYICGVWKLNNISIRQIKEDLEEMSALEIIYKVRSTMKFSTKITAKMMASM